MTNWHCDDDPTPFHLRVYTRNNTFIHPDDLASHRPPRHLDIYTIPSCTLGNLALLIAAERPETFPVPALGTRVAFQHIYPDPSPHDSSSSASLRPRYIARDLGNVVLGGSGIGALAAPEDTDDDEDSSMTGLDSHGRKLPPLPVDEALKFETRTLKSLRFVPGDAIAVAVLPPMDDGHVAPMTTLRRDKGAADRDRSGWGMGRERGGGSGVGREGRRSGGGGFDIPRGDWRRGDRLPEEPFTRAQRGRRRW
ncbi:Sin3 associated polypeptide p18 (SAP18) [Ceratocystis platani]|uniref:Sin3 associated polypeptide p18 (SAP18) n=1 Tax=Ceratocystis fimbriata f. sp. platani TaxID=88771 RepID=A0A0F8D9I1_CERFI|nr:Sin3 associated polypeptide p18 (SAP18) [Ceratocystis platani]